MTMDGIQLKGIDELNEEEKGFIDKIVPEYYEKFKTFLHNETELQVHFKTMKKTGDRKMYDIRAKVISPTKKTFASSNSLQNNKEAWQFSTALQAALKDIEEQIKKEMKKDQSHPRPRD